MFVGGSRETNHPGNERWQLLSEFNIELIYSCTQFWFVSVIPKYLNFALCLIFQRIYCLPLCYNFALHFVQ